jgi:hypothetical protein
MKKLIEILQEITFPEASIANRMEWIYRSLIKKRDSAKDPVTRYMIQKKLNDSYYFEWLKNNINWVKTDPKIDKNDYFEKHKDHLPFLKSLEDEIIGLLADDETNMEPVEWDIDTPRIGNRRLNPSTEGYITTYSWDEGKKFLSSRTKKNAEKIFINKLGIIPKQIKIEIPDNAGNSYYIMADYNGEPIIMARREIPGGIGQTKMISKYKTIPTIYRFVDDEITKDQILSLLKLK